MKLSVNKCMEKGIMLDCGLNFMKIWLNFLKLLFFIVILFVLMDIMLLIFFLYFVLMYLNFINFLDYIYLEWDEKRKFM